MADKIQFFPLDIHYITEADKAIIQLYGRTPSGEQICVQDKTFKPYFWVLLNKESAIPSFQEKVMGLVIENKTLPASVINTEIVNKKLNGRDIKAVKVVVNIPASVPTIREIIKNWEMVKSVLEADILFTRRYLIDKKIIPSKIVEAELRQINRKSKVPVFDATDISPSGDESFKDYKILAIDIETYSEDKKNIIQPEKNPIIMASFFGNNFKKVLTWKRFNTKHKYIEFVKSESELLERIKEIIEEYKPDILTGYNSDNFDLPYIRTRAEKYKIKLDLGLDYSSLKFSRGKNDNVTITGIIHLDILTFIRKVMYGSLHTDSFKLDNVASELLGEKKKDIQIEKMFEAWDKSPEELEIYCEYNLQDSYLTYRLCESIIPLMEEFVKMIGLPLFDVSRMAFSQLVEWFILQQAPEFNELAPNKPHDEELKGRMQKRYKGAFVFEPVPGLYKNIVVFDFRSLYPTIISSHNISPATLDCSCCRGNASYVPNQEEKHWFCEKKKGFLPLLIGDLIKRRMRIKELIKEEKKDKLLHARSEALKLLANSFYGYLGFYAARWYSFESAQCTTSYGRYYIKKVIAEAQKNKFNVLYADTDSIFFTLDKQKKSAAMKFAEAINDGLPGLMELELEGLYPAGIFVSAKSSAQGAKKKYALLREDNTLKIRGFETVRRNWSRIAKDTQEQVLHIVLKEGNKEKAFKYVKNIIDELKRRKVPKEKVIIYTRIQRDIKNYYAIGPHVAVAQKMERLGYQITPGTMIQYIIIPGSGVLRDRAKMPEEVKDNGYDSDYYINNQVLPAVDRIFTVLGYEKEDLSKSKSQEKLNKFL